MLEKIKELVMEGEIDDIEAAVQEALDGGVDANDILQAMIGTMDVIGEQFSTGEIFVPEMLVSAETMSAGMKVVKPHLKAEDVSSLGTCVIGTVEGDMHDIGKNLVAMMFESVGFEVVDLGVDVPTSAFLEAISNSSDVKIVGCSALLTTTMHSMKETVAAVKESYPDIKVMIGGAPVSAEFAEEIGADAYTADAGSAAAKAKEFAA